MKFTGLMISDFMSVKQADVDLEDRGLVLIQGENADEPSAKSNGAGKSTIPDALCWCLFGNTARGLSGDDIIRKGAKKARVQVTLETDGHRYLVQRERKKRSGQLSLYVVRKTVVEEISKGTEKLTQQEVNKILGCSESVFSAAVYSSQDGLVNLPAMTDKALKTIVEEAAGISMLEKALSYARTEWRGATERANEIHNEIANKHSKFDSLKELLAEQDNSLSLFEIDRDKGIERLEAQIHKKRGDCTALEKQLEEMSKTGSRAHQIKVIQAKIDGFKDEERKKKELEKAVQEAISQGAVAKGDFDRQAAALEKLKKSKDDVLELVGSSCGECGKLYERGDITDAEAQLSKRIKEASVACDEAADELAKKERLEKNARTELEKFSASMTDVSKLYVLRERLETLDKEQERVKALLESTNEEIEELLSQVKKLSTASNPYKSRVVETQSRIDALRGELKDMLKDYGEAKKQEELYKAAVDVFSPAGVRAHILDTVTPYLNDKTAQYLGVLSDGNIEATWNTLTPTKSGELREKFSIEVVNKTGGGNYNSLSGGEKRKVRLATALALQDLVASRATKPIDLWIGDEIDDALDDAGLERLMTILEAKARERGSVFVISHNDLADWIRETIVVRKKGGSSTIV